MFKKVISVTILLVCLLSACVASAGVTDSKGNAVNGKLEEYDRRVRGSDSAGFSKNGSYTVDSGYRYELSDGLTDKDIREIEKNTPSLYFNKDGTPKKNTYLPGDPLQRYEEAVKEANREWGAEIEAARQKRLEKEQLKAARKKERDIYFVLFLVCSGVVVLLYKLFNKLLDLYDSYFGKKMIL